MVPVVDELDGYLLSALGDLGLARILDSICLLDPMCLVDIASRGTIRPDNG